jgi:excisionase family DNA binding protein
MIRKLMLAQPVMLDALNRTIPTFPASDPAVFSCFPQDPETPPEPTLHTVEELAAGLRVSTKTIRRRIKDGTIRTVPIGGRLVRVSSDEVRRLISGTPL